MIRFRDGLPTGIYYSQHRDGVSYQWNDASLTKEDGRVSLIFVLLCLGIHVTAAFSRTALSLLFTARMAPTRITHQLGM